MTPRIPYRRRLLPAAATLLATAMVPAAAFSAATPSITVTPVETAVNDFAVSFAGDASYDSADVRVCATGSLVDCTVTSKLLASSQNTITGVTVPSSGRFDVALRVYDATSRSGWSPANTVTLDRSGPTAALDRDFGDFGRTVRFDVSDALTSVDPASGDLEYERLDGTWAPLDTVSVATGELSGRLPAEVSDGRIKVRGSVSDTVGNRSHFGPLTVSLDETAPGAPAAPSSSSAPLTNTAATPVTVTVAADSGPSRLTTYELRDCTAAGSCSSHENTLSGTGAQTTVNLADGDHALTVRIRDRAGNVGAWSEPLTVRVDTDAPTITTTPVNVAALRSGERLSAEVTDTLSGVRDCRVELRHDNGLWQPLPPAADATGTCTAATGKLKRGFYEARATATDHAGNSRTVSFAGEIGTMFTVPDERPATTLTFGGLGTGGKPLTKTVRSPRPLLVVPTGRPAWVIGRLTLADGSPVISGHVAITETHASRTRVVVRRTNKDGRVRHRLRFVAAGARVSFVYAGAEARQPAPSVSYDIATNARSSIVLDETRRRGTLRLSGRVAGRKQVGGIRVKLQTRAYHGKWKTVKVRTSDAEGDWQITATPKRRHAWVRVLLDAPRKSIYVDGRSATLGLPHKDRGVR